MVARVHKAKPENAPPLGQVSPKTHTPEWQMQELGHRYYSPKLGRFISRDPIGELAGPQICCFVWNDPANRWDPVGLSGDLNPAINIAFWAQGDFCGAVGPQASCDRSHHAVYYLSSCLLEMHSIDMVKGLAKMGYDTVTAAIPLGKLGYVMDAAEVAAAYVESGGKEAFVEAITKVATKGAAKIGSQTNIPKAETVPKIARDIYDQLEADTESGMGYNTFDNEDGTVKTYCSVLWSYHPLRGGQFTIGGKYLRYHGNALCCRVVALGEGTWAISSAGGVGSVDLDETSVKVASHP